LIVANVKNRTGYLFVPDSQLENNFNVSDRAEPRLHRKIHMVPAPSAGYEVECRDFDDSTAGCIDYGKRDIKDSEVEERVAFGENQFSEHLRTQGIAKL
jgi:hypothetical protein